MENPEHHSTEADEPPSEAAAADADIKTIVRRLSRPHPSGGRVIERAAIMAEGSNAAAVMAWVEDHGGLPEELVAKAPSGGLHGGRVDAPRSGRPQRYVLPPGALD